jgi:hypothetical protein
MSDYTDIIQRIFPTDKFTAIRDLVSEDIEFEIRDKEHNMCVV